MKLFFKILAFISSLVLAVGLMMMTIVGAFAFYLNVFWKFALILVLLFNTLAIYLALFNFDDKYSKNTKHN